MEREIYVLTSVDKNRSLDDGLYTSVFTSKKECIDSIIETLIEYDYFSNYNKEEGEKEDERSKAITTLRQKIDKTNQFDEPDLYFFEIFKHTI